MNEYLLWFRAATAIKKEADQHAVSTVRSNDAGKPEKAKGK